MAQKQPTPNREQSNLFELPRCEGGKPKVNESITSLRKYIAFIYIHEWRELEQLEQESKEINMLRQKVHDAYTQMLDLTLYGEKVLEWHPEDTIIYRGKRLAMDSLLCEFRQYYQPQRLDSLCGLLADKEQQLFNIWEL